MLDIADEIGEGDYIDIVKKESGINGLFDKSLGAGNISNINIRSDITQTTITRENHKSNIAKSDSINQKLTLML